MVAARRRYAFIFNVIIAVGAFGQADAQVPVERPHSEAMTSSAHAGLGLIGNHRILWIYQSDHSDAVGDVVRFAYRTAEDSTVGRFWSGPVSTGRVARSVVLGTDIYLFFSDGTHHRFAPVRIGARPVGQPRAREIDLPDAALPLAIVADQARVSLYALVPSRVAVKIIMRERREAEAEAQKKSSRDVFGGASEEPETPKDRPLGNEKPEVGDGPLDESEATIASMFEGHQLAVVRYQQGRWMFDRHAPSGLTLAHEIPVMLAGDGQVYLLYRSPDQSKDLHWRRSLGPDEQWSEAVTIFSSDSDLYVAAGWQEDVPVVMAAERGATISKGAVTVRAFRADADLWSATLLSDEVGSPARFSEPVGLSVFQKSIAVASINDEGHPQVSFYDPETGRLTGAPVVVAALIEPPAPRVSPGARQFLQYAVLAAVLMAVFVWRRERVLLIAPIKSEQTFARMDRRFTAFSLDLLILAPIWVPMLYALWRSGAPDLSASEQLVVRQDTQSGPLFWGGAMVGAVFGLYAGILEILMGQTFGKRIVGCRVVREDGEPCDARAVFVRNILRVVEFHFMALVLLVLFTPARQRLGDLLARTIVVEPRLGPPPQADADAATEQSEDYSDNGQTPSS
jgi:uncharacterized RDD family membrane protein YckC